MNVQLSLCEPQIRTMTSLSQGKVEPLSTDRDLQMVFSRNCHKSIFDARGAGVC